MYHLPKTVYIYFRSATNTTQRRRQRERQHEVDAVTSRRARRLPERSRVPRRTRREEGREDSVPDDATGQGHSERLCGHRPVPRRPQGRLSCGELRR